MTALEQAIDLYRQQFGGVPLEVMRGMPEDKIVEALTKALKIGKEITYKQDVVY